MEIFFLSFLFISAFSTNLKSSSSSPASSIRVFIYGSTGGGFGAALATVRTTNFLSTSSVSYNANVTLCVIGNHIGGMITGGLQHTDVGNASVIGGITLEYFHRVESTYPGRPIDPNYPPHKTAPPGWMFESHVAEDVMNQMLDEAGVHVVRNQVGIASVKKNNNTIVSVTTLAGQTYSDYDVFIDASYEGDLLAASGASFTVGREGADQYNEKGGGRRPIINNNQFPVHIDPYYKGTKDVLPLVYPGFPGNVGDADKKIAAYDFRLCMTNSVKNRIPIEKPASYNSSEWELLRRYFSKKPPKGLRNAGLCCLGPIPNNYSDCKNKGTSWCKCDMIGCGAITTDMIGASWDYPNANNKERAIIRSKHVNYTLGMLWFYGNDPIVPETVRSEMLSYGLCKDEYKDTFPPYWPHQLYIREARRLIGDWVFTQNTPHPDILARSIGMGSYVFDSHHSQRCIHHEESTDTSWVVNEGEIMGGIMQKPYSIPYDTLLPKRKELTNLLAAVPVSASHVRYASLRMEPTYMIMGHAAGVASVLAIANTHMSSQKVTVQDVNVEKLQSLLKDQGQILFL